VNSPPPPPIWNSNPAMDDIDALIIIDITLHEPESDGEHLRIVNIQFNNLDIIANQETVAELIGFANRVLPKRSSKAANAARNISEDKNVNSSNIEKVRSEITFDFHRLNVLILRAVMRDNFLVARKVGTFTMSEARIHATVGNTVKVEGSLGGLQVLDLTPEGINHQRILSVGTDPLTDPPTEIDLATSLSNEVYGIKSKTIEERQALSFKITRNLNACVEVKIRMGSVWFTHCARFMQELNWCATEFKHYLK
jgi:vacuolar protein sorting-associated protein 13D